MLDLGRKYDSQIPRDEAWNARYGRNMAEVQRFGADAAIAWQSAFRFIRAARSVRREGNEEAAMRLLLNALDARIRAKYYMALCKLARLRGRLM